MNNKGKNHKNPEYSFWHELAGSLGDLGTLLPYVVAVIAIAGLVLLRYLWGLEYFICLVVGFMPCLWLCSL